jgi:hypothetical protein
MLKGHLEPHCNNFSQTDACSNHILLRDSYHHLSKLFQFCSFTVSTYLIYSIEVIVQWIYVVISVLSYSVCYSFRSTHKSELVVSKRFALHLFFFVHVPD